MFELAITILVCYALVGHSLWIITSICLIADRDLEEDYYDEFRDPPIAYEMFNSWLYCMAAWPCIIKEWLSP